MEETMLTGFGFDSSMMIKPNLDFDNKPVKVGYIDESNRIDFCNLPE